LKEIGVGSIDDLFATVPAEYRLQHDLDIPRQLGESEIIDYFKHAASLNAVGYVSFLGAGAYRHYKPVIIDSLVQRGEFLTSYTPYQAGDYPGHAAGDLRVSDHDLRTHRHGDRQRLDVRRLDRRSRGGNDGGPHYPRDGVMVARSVHPEYREVMTTYAQHQGHTASEVGFNPIGEDGPHRSGRARNSVTTRPPACWCSRRTSSASSKTSPRLPRSCTRKARC
jgi:glycine dehydrogenase subunit 1